MVPLLLDEKYVQQLELYINGYPKHRKSKR